MATNLPVNERQNLRPDQISNNKEDCVLTMTMLVKLNPAAQFYSDFDRCLDLINSIKHEQIFLIVSGSLAKRLLSKTNNHRSLVAVFIFCATRQYHESLTNEYDRIIRIYTDQNSLLESIRQKINKH
jgi:hypothetical protein